MATRAFDADDTVESLEAEYSGSSPVRRTGAQRKRTVADTCADAASGNAAACRRNRSTAWTADLEIIAAKPSPTDFMDCRAVRDGLGLRPAQDANGVYHYDSVQRCLTVSSSEADEESIVYLTPQ